MLNLKFCFTPISRLTVMMMMLVVAVAVSVPTYLGRCRQHTQRRQHGPSCQSIRRCRRRRLTYMSYNGANLIFEQGNSIGIRRHSDTCFR